MRREEEENERQANSCPDKHSIVSFYHEYTLEQREKEDREGLNDSLPLLIPSPSLDWKREEDEEEMHSYSIRKRNQGWMRIVKQEEERRNNERRSSEAEQSSKWHQNTKRGERSHKVQKTPQLEI